MDNGRFKQEVVKAAVAAVVAFVAALVLKGMGAGKWLVAAGSGAIGGVAAIALLA